MKHRLSKLWPIWIRLFWIFAAILIAVLHGMSAVYAYQVWTQIDKGALLTRLGVSIEWAAIYAILMSLIPGLMTASLGGLVFLHIIRSRNGVDRMAMFTAFMLLTFSLLVNPNTDFIPEENTFWQITLVALSFLGSALFFLFIFVFPDGHFRPRWTVAIPYAFVLWMVSWLFFPEINPAQMSEITLALVIAGWLVLAVGVQIYRYLRLSTPDQRQQTKLVAFSLLFLLVIGVFELWLEQQAIEKAASTSTGLVFYLVIEAISNLIWLVFPAALVMAILRYQLWEIDRLINRALVYTLLTLILTGIYFLGVVLLENLLRKLTGQESSLAVVGSTLAIAVIAGPLRGQLQRFIERRFYRGRYDTERVLAEFSQSTREELGLVQLGNRLLGTVEGTIQPEFASLWLIGRPTEHHTAAQRERDAAWRMLMEQE